MAIKNPTSYSHFLRIVYLSGEKGIFNQEVAKKIGVTPDFIIKIGLSFVSQGLISAKRERVLLLPTDTRKRKVSLTKKRYFIRPSGMNTVKYYLNRYYDDIESEAN